MITLDDYLFFVDVALDRMVSIVSELGDELANARLDVAGASSPFAILTHCLGVHGVLGGAPRRRPSHRVRPRRGVRRDRRGVDARRTRAACARATPGRPRDARSRRALRNPPDPEDAHLPFGRTQGTALLHLHRELAPHLGQMEGCRDVLTQGQARLAPSTS